MSKITRIHVGKAKMPSTRVDQPSIPLPEFMLPVHYILYLEFGKKVGRTLDIYATPRGEMKCNEKDIDVYDYQHDYQSIFAFAFEKGNELNSTSVTAFKREWIEKHPRYELFGSNSQLFCKDFVQKFTLETLETQTKAIGMFMLMVAIPVGLIAMYYVYFLFYYGLLAYCKHY